MPYPVWPGQARGPPPGDLCPGQRPGGALLFKSLFPVTQLQRDDNDASMLKERCTGTSSTRMQRPLPRQHFQGTLRHQSLTSDHRSVCNTLRSTTQFTAPSPPNLSCVLLMLYTPQKFTTGPRLAACVAPTELYAAQLPANAVRLASSSPKHLRHDEIASPFPRPQNCWLARCAEQVRLPPTGRHPTQAGP